ncbi:hypothetical protein GCM10009654_48820 [Streptomyces hebeiensis]|uniref:Uncharacterized protein n=1 Tax=Streptomyces hebeiensis TaxID=229486 RepID=A0ABP4FNQ9_9ACTN
MTEPASKRARGFRCECWTQSQTTGARTLIDSITVETPAQAIRYIRVAVRTITPALNPEAFDEAWLWLDTDAHQALTNAKPYIVTLHDHRATIQWTARPVDFLKLTARQAINHPARKEQYRAPAQD